MWNTLMAACTGRGHRLRQQPGQDRTARRTEYGVTAIALADGAGSAPLSHLGAECAVQTACRLLCRDFEALYASPTPQAMRNLRAPCWQWRCVVTGICSSMWETG